MRVFDPTRRRALRAAGAVTLFLTCSAAWADEGPPADEARGLVDPDPVRPVDAALLLPRVVLGFPRAAFDVATLGIDGAARLEDRYHVVSWLEDLFYNDARTAAIIPFISFQTLQGAGGGVVAFHDDLFGHDEHGRLSARFEGSDSQAYQASFSAGHKTWLSTLVRYESDGSLLFHGLGADGPEAHFGQDRFLAVLRGGQRFGPLGVGVTGLYNHRDFDGGTVAERYDTMTIPGFEDGLETVELQGNLALNTRPFRAEAFLGGVPNGEAFWHWGAEATAAFELWAPERVLFLRAAAEGVEGDDVPFTELPRLGGPFRLRGYELDRFRGDTALLGTAEYRYPVHKYVSGALFIDAGHVTDNSWRAGGGVGLIVHHDDKVLLSLQASYGESFQFFISTDPLRAFAKKDTEL